MSRGAEVQPPPTQNERGCRWEINGERLFRAAVVERIRQGGNREAFAKGGFDTLAGGNYRSMLWVFHNTNGAIAARGVHGQTIYVDPTADMVLVRFASYPRPKNALIDPTSLPADQAVADYLTTKPCETRRGRVQSRPGCCLPVVVSGALLWDFGDRRRCIVARRLWP